MKRTLSIICLLLASISFNTNIAVAKSGTHSINQSINKIENDISQTLEDEPTEEANKESEPFGLLSVLCALTLVLSPIGLIFGFLSIGKRKMKKYKDNDLGMLGVILNLSILVLFFTIMAVLASISLLIY